MDTDESCNIPWIVSTISEQHREGLDTHLVVALQSEDMSRILLHLLLARTSTFGGLQAALDRRCQTAK